MTEHDDNAETEVQASNRRRKLTWGFAGVAVGATALLVGVNVWGGSSVVSQEAAGAGAGQAPGAGEVSSSRGATASAPIDDGRASAGAAGQAVEQTSGAQQSTPSRDADLAGDKSSTTTRDDGVPARGAADSNTSSSGVPTTALPSDGWTLPAGAGGSGAPRFVTRRPNDMLPEPTVLDGGRWWVPWPDESAGPTRPLTTQTSGFSFGVEPIEQASLRWVDAVRHLWDESLPPYTTAAREAFRLGQPVAVERAASPGTYELVVDTDHLAVANYLSDDRERVTERVTLCPPYPGEAPARDLSDYRPLVSQLGDSGRIEALGVALDAAPGLTDAAGSNFFVGATASPSGTPLFAPAPLPGHLFRLLTFSPGEPLDVLTGDGLAAHGWFPGDWSSQTKQLLATVAATDSVAHRLVRSAVRSTGPETLFEACADAAALVFGDPTDSRLLRDIELLWSRGLRVEHSAPPPAGALVVAIDNQGAAQTVVCAPAGAAHLVDASSGQRLERLADQQSRAVAMELSFDGSGFRATATRTFPGVCGEGAAGTGRAASQVIDEAVAWLADRWARAAPDRDSIVTDWWRLWVPVNEWVPVSQEQAWRATRDGAWWWEQVCAAGIPQGELRGEHFVPHHSGICTPEQQQVTVAAARAAPPVTAAMYSSSEIAGTWHSRVFGAERRSALDVLGCDATTEQLARLPTIDGRPKEPWPRGTEAEHERDLCAAIDSPDEPRARSIALPLAVTSPTATSPSEQHPADALVEAQL